MGTLICAMIQKESVISWFKSLDGDDRIDLMCNLLDCCLPWEIRFLGTFIEAQVQRDYPAFRQPESTANNPFDLSCLTCLYDVHVRRRLCVSLALLHSSNRQAASVLFGILNDFQPSSLREEEFFTELSLLITMSAHHPAFSFHQKHTLSAKLKQLKQSANHTSDLSEVKLTFNSIYFYYRIFNRFKNIFYIDICPHKGHLPFATCFENL